MRHARRPNFSTLARFDRDGGVHVAAHSLHVRVRGIKPSNSHHDRSVIQSGTKRWAQGSGNNAHETDASGRRR
jgi:hypothetical protein